MSYVSEKQIKQIAQKISNDYAQKNGSYDAFISGQTKQILSTVKINDQVPYTFRTAGGSADIGDRLDDTIVGGTIVWNQIIPGYTNPSYSGTNYSATYSDYKLSVVVTGAPTDTVSIRTEGAYTPYPNHVIYTPSYAAQNNRVKPEAYCYYNNGGDWVRGTISKIGSSVSNHPIRFIVRLKPDTPIGTYEICVQAFDLTAMFGSTIADQIYSLEQSNTGAGVAWFRSLFPKDNYPYNAGELLSVNVSSHDTVGFNAYDNASGKARLIGGMEYQITGAYTALAYSTGETITPDTDGYFTPSENGELTVTGGNATDTCVHLVWDGEKDGEFEEYIKHSYPLDSSLTLRGVSTLDANNKLYYDGDIYESDGTVTRRYRLLNLGTINWTYYTDGTNPIFVSQSSLPGLSNNTFARKEYYNCEKYNTLHNQNRSTMSGSNSLNKTFAISTSGTQGLGMVRDDSYSDTTTFKAAMNGVYVVYAVPDTSFIIESAIPFTNPQIVDDFGTEEYTNPRSNPEVFSTEKTYNVGNFVLHDSHCYRCITAVTEAGEWDSTKWELDDLIVEIPVGHNTDYYPNLRAKLEMAPESPDGETGNYVVNHTKESGENKYIPFSTAIQNDAGLNNELNEKANIDGYYETLTAGTSEQLLSTVSINDKVPYNFRTSGGSADIGNRLTDKIVGGTISWRQLVVNEHFESSSGWNANNGTFSVADNIATFTASAEGGTLGRSVYLTTGHKYILSAMVKTTTETDKVCLHSANSALGSSYTVPSTDWQIIERIYTRSGNTQNVSFGIKDMRTSDWDAVQVKCIVVYDLTQMFGKTIADYINSLGYTAGIAWFKNLFPKNYYAYNAGELLSVNVVSHDTVGFNAFDKNSPEITVGKFLNEDGSIGATTSIASYTGYIKVLPSTRYQFTDASDSTVNRYICWYDAEKNFISSFRDSPSVNVISPPNAYYVRASFNNSKIDAFCINLSWDGEKDGEYESYAKHIYPLDSSLELRGVPLLDSNNKLYYDGDTYESDGTVTRRYGFVDLGTLTWSAYTVTIDGVSTRIFRSVQVQAATRTEKALISSRYDIYGGTGASPINMPDKSIIVGSTYFDTNRQFAIRDSSYAEYTAAQFKEAVSGIYLVYELSSSSYTTETAAPYANPQIVDDFGTEEYVDYAYSQGNRDVAIPVGHDTLYMNNLRAKLEMSPDSPDGDGDYIVRQSSGENTYVPLTKELPPVPTEDGTYKLSVTVTNGEPTYSWEAQA